MSGAAGESPPAEQAARISLRLVLKPVVILTKRGAQLRPMIARLGDDVPAYHALWADRDAFKLPASTCCTVIVRCVMEKAAADAAAATSVP